MNVLYDKPFELRQMQREGHKFLTMVKRLGGDAVKDKKIDKGFLVVNDVRMAPEYLLPGDGRWDYLAGAVLDKVRGWRGPPPSSPETGVLYDVFAAEFAAEKGVVTLREIEEIPMPEDSAEDMHY